MTTTEHPAEIKHLIGTEWRSSSDGATFESRDPHDGSLLATVARGTADDGTAAIDSARTAFDDGEWPRHDPAPGRRRRRRSSRGTRPDGDA